MKRTSAAALLAAILALTAAFTGCGSTDTAETPAAVQTDPEAAQADTEAEQEETDISDDLWTNAVYTENTELGEGELSVTVEVAAGDKSIEITVHTNEDNLGAALTSNSLVTGDESEYGLYIKTVNGIRADYDLDNAYWALSKDGEATPAGADTTMISDGEHYELTYTKG